MSRRRLTAAAFLLLYACATLQFIRFYATFTTFYLNMATYLAGHERLPFQTRILPAILINLVQRIPVARLFVPHSTGAFTSEHAPLFVIGLISMSVAGWYVQALYERVSETRKLSFLVYPVFLFTMMWTYSIHLEANFSYPYDMPAVAFFSAGLYYIYTRRFWLLLAVIMVGTVNRETTLFLIPIYLLDAISMKTVADRVHRIHQRFSLAQASWTRAGVLAVAWLLIRFAIWHRFAHNDASENYIRISENLSRLTPRLAPALLNICGYLLPVIVIFRRDLHPTRFRIYLWVVPLWFAVMFYTGVIVETRVYGELCPYVAIAAVLIIERRYTESTYPEQITHDLSAKECQDKRVVLAAL